jgi:hypothetical protein
MVSRRSFSLNDDEIRVLDRVARLAEAEALPKELQDFLGDSLELAGMGKYRNVYTRSRILRAVIMRLEEMLNAKA